ncbi:hypothetical protein A2164_03150 [Candidatus Curtissbacteria bacterium RBG_13_35_7]|uniref:Glycosyltransferase RgtA/B/C/D-like domain-containing protein n=1 Tax=Candidatus Curtissbacteria bacterium RBG_13_35_7 TaxID=1797705 RepID=A0A1F5G5F9_9BACT|nr:MAG: hypothetical protein A2164_03150 [Candidatus Curtissbacteria bacterium RBG_13_35_7]
MLSVIRKFNWIPIFIILVLSATLLFNNLNKPFIGHEDDNASLWGDITRRYLSLYPITRQDFDIGVRTFKIQDFFYSHYTPFLPILLSFFPAIFGLSEFTLRLTPLFFSVLLILFIYKLSALVFNKHTAILASIFTVITPMFLYFGKLPDHEPIVISLIVITLYFYLKSKKNFDRNYNLFLVFLTLSLFESWSAFFIILPLSAFSFLIQKKTSRQALIPLVPAVIVIVFHLSIIFLINGIEGIKTFFSMGISRSQTENFYWGKEKVNAIILLITEIRYVVIYFTRPLIALSTIWLITTIFQIFRRVNVSKEKLFLLILFIYPLLFILTFRQLAFLHDYKLYHLLPFISISSAYTTYLFINTLASRLNISKLSINFLLICLIISLSITYFTFTERLDYLNTLLRSTHYQAGYLIGKYINSEVKPNQEAIVINSGLELKEYFEGKVYFYANRKIDFKNISLEQFLNNKNGASSYKLLIAGLDRNTDSNFLKYLSKNYTYKVIEGLFFYKLN